MPFPFNPTLYFTSFHFLSSFPIKSYFFPFFILYILFPNSALFPSTPSSFYSIPFSLLLSLFFFSLSVTLLPFLTPLLYCLSGLFLFLSFHFTILPTSFPFLFLSHLALSCLAPLFIYFFLFSFCTYHPKPGIVSILYNMAGSFAECL